MNNKYMRALTVLIVVQAALFYTASRGESTPLPLPLADMPADFGGWKLGEVGVVDDETKAVLKADDLLTRGYYGPGGVANLFIAYFKSQRTGQSPHSPKNCLPGSGFQPVDAETGRIDVPVGDKSIHINKYVVARGDNEDVVLYWYQSQGRVIADEFAAKFYLIEDSIRKHRSDTALVRIVVPVKGVTREQAIATAVRFAQAAYPVVDSWLPR
jgi:EpsI family protein